MSEGGHHLVGGAKAPRDHFDALDSLRGICALLVALHHFSTNTNSNLGHISFVQNSYLFVDFFFVLSGFVICHAYGSRITSGQSLKTFMIRRFGRLWPLHASILIALLAFIATIQLLPHPAFMALTVAKGTRYSIAKLLISAIFLSAHHVGEMGWNQPSWSISAEFSMYLIFGITCLVGRKRLPWVSAAVIVGSFLALSRLHGVYISTTSEFGLVRCALGFFIGVGVYLGYRKVEARALPSTAIATLLEAATVGIATIYVAILPGSPPHLSAMSLGAPFVFAGVVFAIAIGRGTLSNLLVAPPALHLGELSYSLYMVHWPLFLAASYAVFLFEPSMISAGSNAAIKIITLPRPIDADLVAIGLSIATVAVSTVTYRYIEDPWRTFFNRIAKEQEQSSVAGLKAERGVIVEH